MLSPCLAIGRFDPNALKIFIKVLLVVFDIAQNTHTPLTLTFWVVSFQLFRVTPSIPLAFVSSCLFLLSLSSFRLLCLLFVTLFSHQNLHSLQNETFAHFTLPMPCGSFCLCRVFQHPIWIFFRRHSFLYLFDNSFSSRCENPNTSQRTRRTSHLCSVPLSFNYSSVNLIVCHTARVSHKRRWRWLNSSCFCRSLHTS